MWKIGAVAPFCMPWMSSWRIIFGGFWSPVGCLESVSGAIFLTPGMWAILNQYLRVFSLRVLSLVLLIWSRDLSPNIFNCGLWLTAMVRLLQPKMKCRDLSWASATASASPSIRAYLDSAACVNLLPTRVMFQLVLQQKRSFDGHAQCFWRNQ